jgi:hypothetical protein
MTKRTLRVIKWLSQTPAIAVCEFCGQQFKAPMTALTRTKDAQTSLQQQLDLHRCKRDDPKHSGVTAMKPIQKSD